MPGTPNVELESVISRSGADQAYLADGQAGPTNDGAASGDVIDAEVIEEEKK